MKGLLVAFRFLTILPAPDVKDFDRFVTSALFYFPMVGLVLGSIAGFVSWILVPIFSPQVVSVLLVITLIGLTGAFHLDGLADTADGFLSSRPRERILEIMHDSHIGTMGVFGILAVMLIKVSALANIEHQQLDLVCVLMPLTGRCAMVIARGLVPYARQEGLAKQFFVGRRWLLSIWASLILFGMHFLAFAWTGVGIACCILLTTATWSAICLRKIGGGTGDTLGALCEISESVAVLMIAALA